VISVVCVVLVVALVRCAAAATRALRGTRARDRPPHSFPVSLERLARLVEPLLGSRRERRYEEALADALDQLAAAVRAGASVPQAFEVTARRCDPVVGADLTAVVRDLERGTSLDEALLGWSRRRPLRGVELAAAALDLGSRYGGRQATALDAVGEAVRARLALRREVHALSAQARASAWVMAATPVVFATMSAALDPRVAKMLVESVLGWSCMVAGLALDAGAAAWMHRITDTALGPAP
jgi:tight adherence protein B